MAHSTRRMRRISAALALTGAAALVLAGCTTGSPSPSGSTDASGGAGGGSDETITVAVNNAATSLNNATPQSNLNTNRMIGYLTGDGSGGAAVGSLYTIDTEMNIVRDETNVTYELVSEDPLTVQYTVQDGATWSDGEAITVDDLLMSWAIGSGYYDDATYDEESGEVTGGNAYFTLAGSTAGLDTTEFPEIDREAGTLTLTYSEPFVDWELVNLLGKPIHVLAQQADTTVEELVQLLEDTPRGDPENPVAENPTLRAVADFWNTGYDITEMPTDESLLVSAGPFIVTDFVADDGGYVTFEPNPEWGGEPVQYGKLILSFIGDVNAQVTALRNGEVDIVAPSNVSADMVTALDEAGAEVQNGDALSYDHLDLTMDSEVFSDPAVREAFLLTVPRQQILDAVVTPINPEAEVLNSQMFVNSQAAYADATAVNGYADFAEPDIERARELLNGATPTVRILYNTENPNRVDAFQLIKTSAEQAGFVVEDAGSPDWSSLLGSGSYDASIFGWISPGVGLASLPQIWQTGGGGNYNNYSNSEVDALVDESQTIIDDTARLDEIQIEIDTMTAEDFYGLPLFQTPGIDAHMGRVTGVEFMPNQTGVVWNAHTWTVAAE